MNDISHACIVQLLVGVPTYEQRRQMLSVLLADLPYSPDLSVTHIAEKTPGYLPADLSSLIQCAARHAAAAATQVCWSYYIGGLLVTTIIIFMHPVGSLSFS